jgi:hypothetical protein
MSELTQPVILRPDEDGTPPLEDAKQGDQLVITWRGKRISLLVLEVRAEDSGLPAPAEPPREGP